MNYKCFINKTELLKNYKKTSFKKSFHYNIRKKDSILLGYHEYDKEEIVPETYKGTCLKFRKNGANSKLVLISLLDNSEVILNFFYYNPSLFDITKEY